MLHFHLLASVQIVLESFPVSSSGHILLLQKLFENFFEPVKIFFQSKIVDHFLHGPTVLVLIAFFVWRFICARENFISLYQLSPEKVIRFIFLIGLADLVTAVFFVGFKFFDLSFFPLWIGFLCSALALASVSFLKNKKSEVRFGVKEALLLGAVQGAALLPGISRFAIVFVCCRWIGFCCRRAFDLTFAVQLPLIAAAFFNSFLLRVFFKKTCVPEILLQPQSLIIFLCASIVAFFVLLLARFVLCKNKAWIFSLYLLIPVVLSFFV